MGLFDTNLDEVRAGKPKKSDKVEPLLGLNYRGLLDAATMIPVAGDVLSGGLAAYDLSKGDYGSAALNALGMLPFIGGAGMIKGTGKVADVLNAKHSALDGFVSESPSQITLSKLVVPKEMRNQGAGTEFMKDLVATADNEGKVVALTPSSDFGGSKTRLQEFYKRFGFVPNKGRNADYSISESMYRTPDASAVNARNMPKTIAPTKYELAHETARKNAVEMLGLPENNTAMDRARAMGFDTPAYHTSRTGVDTNVLDSGKYAIAPFDSIGTHFGTKEAALDRFNRTVGTTEQIKGSSYPVLLKGDKPYLDANGKPYTEDPLSMMLSAKSDYGNLPKSNAALREEIFKNHSVIPYVNDVEAAGSLSYIAPPQNVRSRFAAFDPARINEPNILGYADPRLLGLIAGGGLLGAGGYSLLGD